MNDILGVQKWFLAHVRDKDGKPYQLDEEQARAVCDAHKNTLVAARAGAGKTHTLVAKIVFLIASQGVKSNEIMAFVFNRKAAKEINERLKSITVDNELIIPEGTQIARTFHSFALRIVRDVEGRGSFGDILVDDKPTANAETSKARSLYIQAIIDQLKYDDEWTKKAIYDFFRKESETIDKQRFESPEEYYDFVRNHDHRTLNGESVKSFGEKVLADFFFEHGVKYKYEPEYYPRDFVRKGLCKQEFVKNLQLYDVIKGDFRLLKERFLWEHWAIRGDETDDEIAEINDSGAVGDYDEYKKKKDWKRWFYRKEWRNDVPDDGKIWYRQDFVKLIESYRPLQMSREEFENTIERICIREGIRLRRLSRDELIKRAWKKQVKYFTVMITQFIDRIQQMFFDDMPTLERIITGEPEDSEDEIRVKRFHQLGLKIYKEYLARLAIRQNNRLIYVSDDNEVRYFGDYGTDFAMLLQKSRTILRANPQARARLKTVGHTKYILVDEYQDFSRLFYDNLIGLRAIFPEAKLFCVGDDWQAINRFAGSDDTYFANFAEHFVEDNNKLLVSHNYRSTPEIVENANSVMKQLLGVSEGFAKAYNETRGKSTIATIDMATIETQLPPEDRRQDSDLQKYVEMISNIILKHRDDKRILILHRKNDMLFNFNVWGVIRHRVRDWMTKEQRVMTTKKFDSLIHFSAEESDIYTVHRSKGLEGVTVILLEADPKVFPSDSHNIELFAIFGDDYETYRKDEARLFYVAITRPKTNLYVLWGTYEHKAGDKPKFVSSLNTTG